METRTTSRGTARRFIGCQPPAFSYSLHSLIRFLPSSKEPWSSTARRTATTSFSRRKEWLVEMCGASEERCVVKFVMEGDSQKHNYLASSTSST